MRTLLCLSALLAACQSPPATTIPGATLRDDGALWIRLREAVALDGLDFRVRSAGRWLERASDFTPPIVRALDPRTTLVHYGPAGGASTLGLTLIVSAPEDAADPILVTPRLSSDLAASAEALELQLADGGLVLPGLDRELLFLQHGVQSWSFTGVLRLRAPALAATATLGEDALREGLGEPIHATAGVGWWFGLVAPSASGPALVVGAASAARHRTAILPSLGERGRAGLRIRVGTLGEPFAVSRDGTDLEPIVLVAHRDANQALARYAAAVGARALALRAAPVADPTGWWSWNVFFDGVTESQVLAHAALLADELVARAGFGLLELDDGYERKWGEWETTDPARFPSGLPALLAEVKRKGLAVGLWLAPFLVDETTALATSHPAWFVRDAAGTPLRYSQLGWSRTTLVLDPTHPEVEAHLRGLFRRLAEAGVSLFKLDFLYAGAFPGGRHLEGVTGTEALRRGLEIIREAAPGAHLNLCGMPVLPAVGRGHSLRTGADIAFSNLKPGFGTIAHEARNVMLRSFLDPLIRSDPDQVLVRAPLSLDEARVAATLAALAGFYTSGDDLTSLPAERRDGVLLRPELLAIARRARPTAAVPLDWLDAVSELLHVSPVADPGTWLNQPRTAVPERYYLAGAGGAPAYLALFNWSGEARATTVDLATLPAPATEARELWEARSIRPRGGLLELPLRPHGVALLELRE